MSRNLGCSQSLRFADEYPSSPTSSSSKRPNTMSSCDERRAIAHVKRLVQECRHEDGQRYACGDDCDYGCPCHDSCRACGALEGKETCQCTKAVCIKCSTVQRSASSFYYEEDECELYSCDECGCGPFCEACCTDGWLMGGGWRGRVCRDCVTSLDSCKDCPLEGRYCFSREEIDAYLYPGVVAVPAAEEAAGAPANDDSADDADADDAAQVAAAMAEVAIAAGGSTSGSDSSDSDGDEDSKGAVSGEADVLASKSYSELQAMAKARGIRANTKKEVMVKALKEEA